MFAKKSSGESSSISGKTMSRLAQRFGGDAYLGGETQNEEKIVQKKSADNQRAQLVKAVCSMNGFEQEADTSAIHVEEETPMQRVVNVRSANAGYEPRSARSIGAPASISTSADAGQLTVATNNSPWELFFGEGQFPYKDRYDVNNQSTWTLPQALQGQSTRIADTIELLTLINGNWYTERVAPIVRTNTLSINWSTWVFSPHLTDVIPELGVNRMVQSRREHNSASSETPIEAPSAAQAISP